MSKRIFSSLVMLVLVFGLLGLLSGCAKKELRTDLPPEPEKPKAVEVTSKEQPKAAATDATMREQQIKEEMARKRMMFLNELVHFDFDKYNIRPDAAEVLKRKADWLKENPDVAVIIEGHCDERGTEAYNLALGDRRANSAKKFLASLGVDEKRLEAISYGKERPLDPRHNEEAWAKNRRAQFVIK